MRYAIAAVMAGALVAGCGAEESSRDRTLSCEDTSAGMCETITGSMTDTEFGDLRAECVSLGRTYVADACPTANAVPGHCHMELGGGFTKDSFYATSNWTLETAMAECASPPPGTWVP